MLPSAPVTSSHSAVALTAPRSTIGDRIANIVVFRGMCDASGAVPLSADRFAIADDEDNVLRVYDANKGGMPLVQRDLSQQLGLRMKVSKKTGRATAPETDIEAATRIDDLALWLTSHGRSSSGKMRSERLYLFATTAPEDDSGDLQLVGDPVTHLLDVLLTDPRYAQFGLEEAAQLAPKAPGGLNIEGMTARNRGGVWVGLRNPIPRGRALLISLNNPVAAVTTQSKLGLGAPVLLDLGGGVRALSSWHGHYLIAAGHFAGQVDPHLFLWDGASRAVSSAPRQVPSGLNPEGFFTPEDRSEFLVFSDDGDRVVEGKPCKKHTTPAHKSFRGAWADTVIQTLDLPAVRAG